jgi:hypothetical protein
MSLSGRILRVDIDGFKVAMRNLPVGKPHWRENGPTRPAAVAAGSAARTILRIVLDQVSDAATMGLLTGRLGTLTIRGRCQLAVGEQEVTASLTGDPLGGFRMHAGDAVWSILPDGASAPLPLATTTRLEVFELLGEPSTFYSKSTGVWVEAMRFLVDRVGVTGVSNRAEAVERIASFCHRDHGLRYDTQDGASHFFRGIHLAVFKLSDYLRGGPPHLVNCYDQAAAVQALSGALGIDAQYCYLRPFGYLQVVDLVGVGLCNNPFFLDPDGGFPPDPIVNGTPRSFFDNHTFCRVNNRIYDACIGPHVGAHPADTYLASVIDTTVPHCYGLPQGILHAGGVWKVK